MKFHPHSDPPNQIFDPTERLFRRVRSEDIVDGKIVAACLDLPGCSFDRELYTSNPKDALDPRKPGFSVVWAMVVNDIPSHVFSPGGVKCNLFPHHVPLIEHLHGDDPSSAPIDIIDKYPHTEVRLCVEGKEYTTKPSVMTNKIFKKEVRELLADKMSAVI